MTRVKSDYIQIKSYNSSVFVGMMRLGDVDIWIVVGFFFFFLWITRAGAVSLGVGGANGSGGVPEGRVSGILLIQNDRDMHNLLKDLRALIRS